MEALERAIEKAGGVGALALLIGVTTNAIYNWRGRKSVGEAQCPDIERATAGSVTVDALRPDVQWRRVPDDAWPHPGGRPCIDVARRAAPSCAAIRPPCGVLAKPVGASDAP